MSNTTFGPLRSKLPRKPWITNAEVRFWYCGTCKRVLHEYLPDRPVRPSSSGENTPCNSAPCGENMSGQASPPHCCGAGMEALYAAAAAEIVPELEADYDIVGGFNNNAVKVYWNAAAASRPVWIALQTYTGVYLKHVPPAKKSPVIFPLSDEDAYAYCDREVCEKCLYCCKKGFKIYVYMGEKTLAVLPLDKIAAYFQNKSL